MIATELRIGNYVEWNNTKLIVTCINIDFCIGYDKLKEESIHDQTSKPMFKPIPLTEDILLKCGLVKDEWEYTFPFNNGSTAYSIQYYGDKLGFSYSGELTKETWITSLHQLQNLYFALTGEELTIKL